MAEGENANSLSTREELIVVARRLSTMIRFGVPIVQALKALEDDPTSEGMGVVTRTIRQQIEAGATLSEALSGFPDVFGGDVLCMVRAGEVSGALADALARLVEMLSTDFHRPELRDDQMSRAEIAEWCWRLGHFIASGVPILQALKVTAEMSRSPLREMTTEMRARINSGGRMAEPRDRYEQVLPAVLLRLIAVGEECGQLDVVLKRAAQDLGAEAQLEAEGKLPALPRLIFKISPELEPEIVEKTMLGGARRYGPLQGFQSGIVEKTPSDATVACWVDAVVCLALTLKADTIQWNPMEDDTGEAVFIAGDTVMETVSLQYYKALADRVLTIAELDPSGEGAQDGRIRMKHKSGIYETTVHCEPAPEGIRIVLRIEKGAPLSPIMRK